MWNILFIIKSICLLISIWFFEKLFLFETCNSRNRDFDESRSYVNLVKSFQVFLRRGHTFLKQFGNFYRYFSTNKARFAFWTWKTISIRPRIVTYLHLIHSTSVARCHLPICEVVERLIMNESALDATRRMYANGDLKNCNKNIMFLFTRCY